MKLLPLLLCVIFSAGVAAADMNGLRIFYCVHSEHRCKETTKEISVSRGDASLVARRALATKDDFVGFIDPHENILQFYVEDTNSILADMPVPELKGSYTTHLNRAQALKLIASLSSPLSRYRSDLKMKFAKWN